MSCADWVEDARAAAEEARRRAKEREELYAVARHMRDDGHSLAEIRERTGVPLSTLGKLFRGLGRRA